MKASTISFSFLQIRNYRRGTYSCFSVHIIALSVSCSPYPAQYYGILIRILQSSLVRPLTEHAVTQAGAWKVALSWIGVNGPAGVTRSSTLRVIHQRRLSGRIESDEDRNSGVEPSGQWYAH
jgi:hypothetical protein